jgi:pyruvate/2-oxoglutarate dehydrogenase complex dihydrolipoamide acyltransferase (E2) component
METTDEVTGSMATEWSPELATVFTGAVELARAAIVEGSGDDTVGEYLGVGYEDPTSATHRFLAHLPGYQGWQWAVVVAGYPGTDHATVSEVVLVPGPGSLLAPEWLPWDQRVRPGDLNPGDLLAPSSDDPRLVPGYLASGDPQLDETAAEIGLGRRQVMSAWGRAQAAERWHDGDYGPRAQMAQSTKRICRDCGFFLPLAGSLGAMFGVCGNELSADGHIVDFQYGCGAHSDTPASAGSGSPMYDPFDDGVLDVSEKPAEAPVEESAEAPAAQEPAEAPAAEESAEAPAAQEPAEAPAAEEPAEAPAAQEPAEASAEEPAEPS